MDALTQLERLRTLIDEICRKLRVKVQRHGPGERWPKSGQSTMSTRSRSAAGDGPLPEVFNKLSQPTKRRQPGSEAKKENKTTVAGPRVAADGLDRASHRPRLRCSLSTRLLASPGGARTAGGTHSKALACCTNTG